jgi:hypothetical protein
VRSFRGAFNRASQHWGYQDSVRNRRVTLHRLIEDEIPRMIGLEQREWKALFARVTQQPTPFVCRCGAAWIVKIDVGGTLTVEEKGQTGPSRDDADKSGGGEHDGEGERAGDQMMTSAAAPDVAEAKPGPDDGDPLDRNLGFRELVPQQRGASGLLSTPSLEPLELKQQPGREGAGGLGLGYPRGGPVPRHESKLRPPSSAPYQLLEGGEGRPFGGRETQGFEGRSFGGRESQGFEGRSFGGRESQGFEGRSFGGRESQAFEGRSVGSNLTSVPHMMREGGEGRSSAPNEMLPGSEEPSFGGRKSQEFRVSEGARKGGAMSLQGSGTRQPTAVAAPRPVVESERKPSSEEGGGRPDTSVQRRGITRRDAPSAREGNQQQQPAAQGGAAAQGAAPAPRAPRASGRGNASFDGPRPRRGGGGGG